MTLEHGNRPNEQKFPYAKPALIEWSNRNDMLVFFRALQIAEVDLGINIPYQVYLTQNSPIVTDSSGEVARVELGALITWQSGEEPQVVITQIGLDESTNYIAHDSLGNVTHQLATTREEEIAIRVAEEVYHLHDYLHGRIPIGTIDRENNLKKYEEPGHEQDAMFYRFRLLAQMFPNKWKEFDETIRSSPAKPTINITPH